MNLLLRFAQKKCTAKSIEDTSFENFSAVPTEKKNPRDVLEGGDKRKKLV